MEFLSREGIPFIEKNIRDDPAALDRLIELGSNSTPTFEIDGKVLIGFQKEKRLQMLGKAK